LDLPLDLRFGALLNPVGMGAPSLLLTVVDDLALDCAAGRTAPLLREVRRCSAAYPFDGSSEMNGACRV
jgi:hypothetical protein